MGKNKDISLAERTIIIELHKKGQTLRKIGETVGRRHTSIRNVIYHFKKTGCLVPKSRPGRPPKLTQREQRAVINAVQQNCRTPASKIAENIQRTFGKVVSSETVRRILKKSEYQCRVARKKPFISRVNRQKRIDFAKSHINKPPQFWKQVIFSDESKFCIFGMKGRQLIWRKPCSALQPKNLCPTVKHGGGGIMVWGCMSSNGVGNLEFIPSTMDSTLYIEILKRNLVPSAEKLNLGSDFIFQQDNDPKHTAFNTRLFLLYKVKKQLKTPPQSPDLNPIEHLWDLLEKRIRNHVISSKEMLKAVLLEEWNKITEEETSKLVASMPKRLKEVLKNKGYPTSY